jgi:glyoxylate/hydroxypyruvate reductase
VLITYISLEHVDLQAIAERGIKLGYTPDVLTDAGSSCSSLCVQSLLVSLVADLSVMLALMVGRNAGPTMSLVQDGKECDYPKFYFVGLMMLSYRQWPEYPWSPFAFCGPQLSANSVTPVHKIGFLGFGRISQAILARLVPFGVTHCIYSSNPSSEPDLSRDVSLAKQHNLQSVKRVGLDELARESDILFTMAPGGDATKHIINEEFLKEMNKTGILVNAGRGTLVDSDALAKALREGWLWGAGLDVVEGEPGITADHPLVGEPR